MGMRKGVWIVVLGLFFPQLSCAPETVVDYFPLENGIQWEYYFRLKLSGVGEQEGKAIARVDRQEKIGEEWYFRMITQYQGSFKMKDEVTYYRKTEDGVYQIAGPSADSPRTLIITLPPTVGAAWTVEREGGRTEYKYEAIEDLEIAGKQYPGCYKISIEDFDGEVKSTGYDYIAPGVGVVKRMLIMPRVTLEWSLEKFES